MLKTITKNIIYVILFVYAILAALTIVFFNGTGDSGDSIFHYLFAKYAPVHPELFLDLWAKPVYVLLACPFAQFGFVGVKVFNVLVSLATIFFTYKISRELTIKNAVISAVIMMFTPLYYILTFSGLTEPLFALVIAVSIYLVVKQKYLPACLIISFIPFIRSEGLIIIGVFGLYFIIKKQVKMLPWLLFGSLFYSLAGYFVYDDFLWVIDKIPYASVSSPYGSGTLFHFTEQFYYVVGFPIYILFWIGIISIILRSIKKKIRLEEQILLFLGFVCFFISHSLFWYFGIFNSMGLKRVLIGVMPMVSVISLQGFNFVSEDIIDGRRILKLMIQGLMLAYIVIFPFTFNPAAINWKKDMMLGRDQQEAIKSAEFSLKIKGTNSQIIFSDPYLYEVLNMDCFDNHKLVGLTARNIDRMNAGDLIIWENWFAVVESKIKERDLDQNTSLVRLYKSKTVADGREILYSVYWKK